MAVKEWDGDGPAWLFVHGLARAGNDWTLFAQAMGPSWRRMALDLRGHGSSTRGQRYLVPDYVDDIETVLPLLSARPVILMGHSLGALVPSRWRRNNPTGSPPSSLRIRRLRDFSPGWGRPATGPCSRPTPAWPMRGSRCLKSPGNWRFCRCATRLARFARWVRCATRRACDTWPRAFPGSTPPRHWPRWRGRHGWAASTSLKCSRPSAARCCSCAATSGSGG
ncbi:MAG: alpha/beta fold hydrolase [Planctomycetota bacterium]